MQTRGTGSSGGASSAADPPEEAAGAAEAGGIPSCALGGTGHPRHFLPGRICAFQWTFESARQRRPSPEEGGQS